MAFLSPLMTSLVLNGAGSVLHKIEDEFKSSVRKVAIDEFSGLVANQIKKDPNGIIATVVQKNTKTLRSCACHKKYGRRRVG